MSIEVSPGSLRAHAAFLRSCGVVEFEVVIWDRWADRLEREQRPLPTVPGWYPGVVVERGGESCTGALLTDFGEWVTARPVLGRYYHGSGAMPVHIRWAEQDGKTPGEAAQNAWYCGDKHPLWNTESQKVRDRWHRAANAVLAVHGTPTLTPVGEHPEPGTRGLLPVRFVGEWGWMDVDTGRQVRLLGPYQHTIVTDPRPEVE